MSENQIQAGGIELELSNTKKNLMKALNQNADLQKQVEELEVKLTKAADAYNQSEDFGLNCEMKLSNASQRIKELEHNLSAKESQCDLYSQEIDANLKRIKELEAEIAGLKLILEKLQWVHQSDAYKFETYEGCLVCGSSIVENHLENCVLNKALSTPTGSKLLDDLHELRRLLDCRAGKLLQQGKYFIVVSETEPYFSSVYDVIRLFERAKGTWNDEDEIIYQKKVSNIRNDEFSSESLKLLIKLKAENSKLLAKVEAGEKCYQALSVIHDIDRVSIMLATPADSAQAEAKKILDSYKPFVIEHNGASWEDDCVTTGGLMEAASEACTKALSAYRAACAGGGEGSNRE